MLLLQYTRRGHIVPTQITCSTAQPCMVYVMKEMVLHLPERTYERLVAEATAAHKSPEQWILDRLFPELPLAVPMEESHVLLTAALDTLGFQRLAFEKATRLSKLLQARKAHPLSPDEASELQTLMAEAEALELTSLQRLAETLRR